jgi:hypothetical protein
MYPRRELNRLAAYQAALRWKIALRRDRCARDAAHVAQPVARLDQVLVLWRQLSPLAPVAGVLLGALTARIVFRRIRLLGSLVRWAPLVFGAARGFCSLVQTRAGSTRISDGQP